MTLRSTRALPLPDSPADQESLSGRCSPPKHAAGSLSVEEILRLGTQTLVTAGIEDTGLEAEVLLRHVLGLDRAHLFLALSDTLTAEKCAAFTALLQRRLRHEPVAYIVGHREFYGADLAIDQRVLIPRPETELLVECALEWASRHPQAHRIADIGTGSGAIAIALALNLPEATVLAGDISAEALEVARVNCLGQGVAERVMLVHGDLLACLAEPVDLIVANLPYIETSQMDFLSPDICCFEPAVALDGGEDGLEVVRRLLSSALSALKSGGALLLEIGQGQGDKALRMASNFFPQAEVSLAPDMAGIMRVLRIETSES
ncbi:MAG: peptide chain release factor N(5)-glutamine methyltransferase [Dehalococcoidia bacterium]|nr:peptide chain release factor N(5)-glutamine methyltransferase [Dehalococcoidia bacterium]